MSEEGESLRRAIFDSQLGWISRMEDFRNLANTITPENKKDIIDLMDNLIATCAKIVEDGA